MMNYIQYYYNETETLLEIDNFFYSWRQIDKTKTIIYTTSNRPNQSNIFILVEGEIHLYNEMIEITREDFEMAWNVANIDIKMNFEKIKHKYPIGLSVESKLNCHYPHGTISSDENGVFLLTDYNRLSLKFGATSLYPGFTFISTVIGYEEINFWIITDVS